MNDRTEVEGDGVSFTRRGVLGVFAALATIAAAPDVFAAPIPGRKPALGGARGVRAVHLYSVNTGERVKAPYWQNGRYIGETMKTISRIMRDHRSGEQHRIDPLLIDALCAMQMRLGASKPIEIISGYRSPESNEALRLAGYGVAEHSYHMQGKAVDIRVPGYRVSQLSKMAKMMRRGGVGTYGSGNFVHIDTGPIRYW
ncbi:MAG: DUF882 domain-containing protein [Alphaproteobacteria bacterium]|nr:DUF882 domain-containing protein [Alphaproteobacteria bacterium]